MSSDAKTNLNTADFTPAIEKIIKGVEEHFEAYDKLETLCTKFGSRLSGSSSLEQALTWAATELKRDGMDKVWEEEVSVPNWKRGQESGYIISTTPGVPHRPLTLLAVGLSVGTPEGGLEGEVVVVDSYEQMFEIGEKGGLKGKIVLIDWGQWEHYGRCNKFRRSGAHKAGKLGAIAVLIKSLTPYSLNTPHTGSMSDYKSDPDADPEGSQAAKKQSHGHAHDGSDEPVCIPAACCTTEDAALIRRLIALRAKEAQTNGDAAEPLRIHLELGCKLLPDAKSRNVIAEVKGREKPDEIVLLGAHMDSWDVGQGAHDDGQGCVAIWDAVRIIKKLGLTPRRTLRVVLFTDEEVRSSGAKAYKEAHKDELEKHVAAFETDAGAFTSNGFRYKGSKEGHEVAAQLAPLLKPLKADEMRHTNECGVDVAPIVGLGVPGFLLSLDDDWWTNDYWRFHHTTADTFDKIDKSMLLQNTQVLACMAYMLAEMPTVLHRASSQ